MTSSFGRFLVVYDISDDSLRRKVIKILERFGLERIQYSVFFGEIFSEDYSYFLKKLRKLELAPADSVLVFPVSEFSLRGVVCFGERSEEFRRLIPKYFFS